MRKIINRIIFKFPEGADNETMINIYCSTKNDNLLAKYIFVKLDTFVQEALIAINIKFGKEIFLNNQMNIVLAESDIVHLVETQLKEKCGVKSIRTSQEQTLRAFNFIKPSNLLPNINHKIYTLRFKGVTDDKETIGICVNPFFYGFLISYSILTIHSYSELSQEEVFDDILKILEDKYGEDFMAIFWDVKNAYNKGIELARQRGDKADESFIQELTNISGLPSSDDFVSIIYTPFINYCTQLSSELKS